MASKLSRQQQTRKRHMRVRKKITGTAERPRLAVFRSGKHIYVQLIDDVAAKTLASASTLEADVRTTVKSGANVEAAKFTGNRIAEKAKASSIKNVVFDRGGNLYHGRIKALADAAREGGLEF